MLQMSSTDATFHAAQDLVYALQNPAPENPLIKLGNGHKEALRNLDEIFIKKNPSSTSKSASQRGIQRETPTGEPRNNPN